MASQESILKTRLWAAASHRIAAHLTPNQAAASVPDEFKRAVWVELDRLEVECVQPQP